MINVMQSGIASAERVFELLDVAEENDDDAVPLDDPRGPRAGWSSTTCRSPTTPTNPLIDGPLARGRARQTVAIVGPTGAGKTTLVNLHHALLRARRAARSRLDGVDIAKMSRRDLRSNMGMVLQDTWLFGGTIRENIAYGNLDATDEQILEAARRPTSTASCTRCPTATTP